MFVDCCYCKRASWKIGLESNELPSLNKEFTYLLTYLLTGWTKLVPTLVYGRDGQLGHLTQLPRTIFRPPPPPTHGGSTQTLALISQAVSEKMFEIVDGRRSKGIYISSPSELR